MAAQPELDTVDARVVKALGHPTRARILHLLRDRELVSPVELAGELGVPLGTIGYHVRRLEQLGFIELARQTQRRGAIEHHYRVRSALEHDGAVAEPGPPRTGRDAAAVALARTAQAALPHGGFDAAQARADRRVVVLDGRGRAELARVLPRWQATVERIAHESERRLSRGRAPTATHRCIAAVLSFDVPDDAA